MNFKKCNRIAVLFVALTLFAFGDLNAQAGLDINNAIKIGQLSPTCTPADGMIQWNGTNYQVYNSGTWNNILTGIGGSSSLWTQHSNTQDIFYNTRNVGIGSGFTTGGTAPLSPLSVGGDGNTLHTGYFESAGNTSGNSALYGTIPSPGSGVGHLRAIYGYIESGTSHWKTYGVYGNSSTTTPSSSGRAFGVYGVAGNATSGYNYGVFGRLNGSNDGAGIVGVDGDLYTFEGDINGKWAAYLWGNSHFSNKVAIGTTDIPNTAGTLDVSDFNLFVTGGILTEEIVIRLESDWADYVFEEDYDLKPLAEVEAIIKKEGHLHNTPSAKEIDENGLQVGDMMVNQQEKIEELFLHLIEMKKDMDALKAENVALKAEVKTLKQ